MTAIGDGRGIHVVYDWDADRVRSFRSYPNAHAHAVKLQNRGHDITVWTEVPNGQDTAKWPGVL